MKLEHIMLQFLITIHFFYLSSIYSFKWKINTIDNFYVTKDKFLHTLLWAIFSAAHAL